MRVIKFRGRRVDNNEWVYGYLYKLQLPIEEACLILTQDNNHLDESLAPKYDLAFKLGVDLFIVDPETVGQFTSLRDKNGKDIYEGDLLKAGDLGVLEVRFVRGVFAFLWNGNLDDEFPTGSPTQEWADIIGNIHDNPDLIKGAEE